MKKGIMLRATEEERDEWHKKAKEHGFCTLSGLIRFLVVNYFAGRIIIGKKKVKNKC